MSSNAETFVDRVQNFVSDNKRAILLGTAAVVAVGGAAVYYASSSSSPNSDVEKAERRKDKKKGGSKSSKKKSSTSVNDPDGPILEERKPKAAESDEPLTAEQIAALSEQERSKLAASLKAKGNDVYKAKKFGEAAEFYTRAINVTPKPEPVFYSNRAACYINMSPPKNDLVVADCDEALKLDPKYVKALTRRANALEALEKYEDALRDFTAATILGRFADESTAQAVERVLKKLSTKVAGEMVSTREPRLPSHNFISAYFAAFRPRPHPTLPESPSTGDETLLLALQALDAADYVHAMSLVNEALEQGISWDEGKAEGLNLRGTFRFLVGDVNAAKEDLQACITLAPGMTQSWVKIASVYMEQQDAKKAFECFEDAIQKNENDPDIYYHRGQVLFIMNQFEAAAENYTKSTALDDSFVFSHIQLAVAQYKAGRLAESMTTFRETLKKFPRRSEPHNYYGEILLDQGRFPDAVDKFDRAIELEKEKTPPNVLPLVNKGLALYQWKQDLAGAEKCCLDALESDPECDSAVATLAQLALQQTKIEDAVGWFEKSVAMARSEGEVAQALSYLFATKAQMAFMQNYPGMAEELSQLGRQV